MARYARIFASIWDDDDFRALHASAQRLYILLITQPNVSHCGVLPLSERRWSRLAPDTDADSVRADLDDLQRAKFVVVDRDSEEMLARTYMKWAEFYRVPNGAKACWKAIDQVASKTLRTLCRTLLETLLGRVPETVPERVGPLLEQATSNQQPLASSLQQHSGRATVSNAQLVDNAAAAYTETVELALEHRRSHTTKITNQGRWAEITRAGIIDEHGPRIRDLLAIGRTPEQVVDAIYKRQSASAPRDLEADNARSTARARVLVGLTPAEAYAEVIASYPRQHAAICDELDWTPVT